MARYTVRAASPPDVGAIKACIDASYRHYLERLDGVLPGPMRDDYAEVIRTRRSVMVAEHEGAIVGVLVLDVTDQGFCLETVGVVPEHWGKGLGRTLVELAESEARKAGFDAIYLYTHQKMNENQALYRRIGYAEYDRCVDDGLPRVFMRKRL